MASADKTAKDPKDSKEAKDGALALRRVQKALEKGEIKAGDLTARSLATVLGQTTSVIYHRWGSLDGMLFALGTLGWSDLATSLAEGSAKKLAESYVAFGLDHPALYRLMTDHPFDRDALRAGGIMAKKPSPLVVIKLLNACFEKRDADDREVDAQVFHAGLHGLVMFSLDRETSLRAARRLARKLS